MSGIDPDRMERWHRDSGGNPARLLRMLAREVPARKAIATAGEPSSSSEPLVPSRPPLRVEEGLIEVGWDSEEPEPEPGMGEEPVADHYAALQAWDEWARNQGRSRVPLLPDPIDPELESDEEPEELPSEHVHATRAEAAQEFAPYSQLFSRAKPLQGAE